MQNFMIKKGLLTDDKLQELLGDENDKTMQELEQPPRHHVLKTPTKKQSNPGKVLDRASADSSSEVTIYHRVVNQITTDIEGKIDQLIAEGQKGDASHKVPSSLDELMDTSDELEIHNELQPFSVSGKVTKPVEAGEIVDKTPEE